MSRIRKEIYKMENTNKEVIKDLDRVIRLIKTDSKDITPEEKKQMVEL